MRKGETSVQNSSYLTPLYSQMGEYILFCSFSLLLIAGTETIVQPSVMFLLSLVDLLGLTSLRPLTSKMESLLQKASFLNMRPHRTPWATPRLIPAPPQHPELWPQASGRAIAPERSRPSCSCFSGDWSTLKTAGLKDQAAGQHDARTVHSKDPLEVIQQGLTGWTVTSACCWHITEEHLSLVDWACVLAPPAGITAVLVWLNSPPEELLCILPTSDHKLYL